jgi:hypothetical protein
MQQLGLVLEWAGQPMPTQFQRQSYVIEPGPMSVQTRILRGYHHGRRGLSGVMPGV